MSGRKGLAYLSLGPIVDRGGHRSLLPPPRCFPHYPPDSIATPEFHFRIDGPSAPVTPAPAPTTTIAAAAVDVLDDQVLTTTLLPTSSPEPITDSRLRGDLISSVRTDSSANPQLRWCRFMEGSGVDSEGMTTPATYHLTLPAPRISPSLIPHGLLGLTPSTTPPPTRRKSCSRNRTLLFLPLASVAHTSPQPPTSTRSHYTHKQKRSCSALSSRYWIRMIVVDMVGWMTRMIWMQRG